MMNQSSNSLKRTKIRPPRKILSNLEVDFTKSWEVLSSAIVQIQSKNSSNLSFEELYRTSYNLVLRKFGKQLYRSVSEAIRKHLISEVREKIWAVKDEKEFLVEVNRQWQDHLLSMRMISDVLMYLDRVYSKENHLPLIYDVGLNLFQDCIIKLNDREIGIKVTNIVIKEINGNRDTGIIMDKFLIKAIIYMLETLVGTDSGDGESYYTEYFEPLFLETSGQFYDAVSKEFLGLQNGSLFLTKIDQLIKAEEQRIVLYLPDATLPKLIDLMNRNLIAGNIDTVLKFENEGLRSFITNKNLSMLQLAYKLITRYDTDYTVLKIQLNSVLLAKGEDLIAQIKAPVEKQAEKQAEKSEEPKKKLSSKENLTLMATKWIQSVLELRDKYQEILKESFESNLGLMKTIEDSFSQMLNLNTKVSEYLSLYIDDSIKRSLKNKSEEETEELLERAVLIFRYIKDKDLFEKYYKSHLAKRLLSQKSGSRDIEREMISRIKQEIGPSFTSNLEGMFRDIKVSKELMAEFKALESDESSETFIKKKLELDVNVLTSNAWPLPLSKDLSVIYPEVMEALKKRYEEFYLSKHNARHLHWAPNFGNVDLRMRFKKKLYEINMSTYASLIIMLFDGSEPGYQLTCLQIQERTNIPRPELGRQLQSLAVAPRTRLLSKSPMTKDINDSDVFTINENFSSPLTKLKVFTVSLANKLEDDSERSKTIDALKKSRKYETDAAIVRIMKARKVMRHNELLGETIRQLQHRFKPPPSLIKQRIEELLEREYLARDSEDRSVYKYLA